MDSRGTPAAHRERRSDACRPTGYAGLVERSWATAPFGGAGRRQEYGFLGIDRFEAEPSRGRFDHGRLRVARLLDPQPVAFGFERGSALLRTLQVDEQRAGAVLHGDQSERTHDER